MKEPHPAIAAAREAFEEANRRRRSLERERDAEIAVSRAAIHERHAPGISEAAKAESQASRAYTQALSDHAEAHPWEGKRVFKLTADRYTGRAGKKVFGVVEVRRVGTKLPQNITYNAPAMGAAFVRLLNADGKPGGRIDRYLGQWKLEGEPGDEA